jgi:hypothetical protein
VVCLVGRILNGCQNVITLKIGIVLQNLLVRRPGTEELQNVGNANSHAPDAGASAALPSLNRDSFQKVGLHRASTLPLKGVPDKAATRLPLAAIRYTVGASEKDEEEAIRKAVDFSTTARRQTVDWSAPPCEARFWDWKLGPAKAHYL